MSTNAEIITYAMQELGALAAGETPTADDAALCLRKLNQMMALMKQEGIDLGYFTQSSQSDTCPIPDWSELAITMDLAVLLSASFTIPVTPELAATQSAAHNSMLVRVMNMKLEGADMSHLPGGVSHYNVLTG